MKAIPVWDIDSVLQSYAEVPEENQKQVVMQYQMLFRFMNDNKLLTKHIVDKSGALKVRKLYRADFTRIGNTFAEEYEAKWFGSRSSYDTVKGPKLLEKYLKELRASNRRS